MTSDLYLKLEPYFSLLSYSDVSIAQYAIGRYILLGNARQYNIDIKPLYKNVHKVFRYDVKEILNNDLIVQRIWRAIYLVLRGDCSWNEASLKFGVKVNDTLFCWEGLDKESRQKVEYEAKNGSRFLELLSDTQLSYLLKDLTPACESIAFRKLRFIKDNDHAFEPEDLVQELLMNAVRIIRWYEHFTKDGKTHDLVKIKNYTRRALNNYAVNMIGDNTKPSKARVENITTPCGICEACKENKPTKCVNVTQDFRATTLSLDVIMTSEQDGNLYNLVQNEEDDSSFQILESLDNLRHIKRGLSKKIVRFIDIVTGDSSPFDFNSWLKVNYCLSIDDLTHEHKKLAKYACMFLKLKEEDVRDILAPRCVEMKSKRSTKCISCKWFEECKPEIRVRKNTNTCDEYVALY